MTISNNEISSDSTTGLVEYCHAKIGTLLKGYGLIDFDDVEEILRYQKTTNLLFGEAAIKLKLVEEQSVRLALAQQYSFPYFGQGTFSKELVVANSPFSKQAESMRKLRSHLLMSFFGKKKNTLAIISPDRGEGRSFLVANLAVVFAQLRLSILLIDADLRNPRQHKIFNVLNKVGLSSYLDCDTEGSIMTTAPQLRSLALIKAGPTPPNPLELLSGQKFKDLLKQVQQYFDVILIDTPPGMDYADAQTIAGWVDGVLLVTRKNHTQTTRVNSLLNQIKGYGIDVVGAVLNRY